MKKMKLLLATLVACGLAAPISPNITELATRYQSPKATQLGTPSYFKAKLCDHSIWSVYKTVTVSMIIPENPECKDELLGCIYVEAFNNSQFSGKPFAVNYYFDGNVGFKANFKFTFKYDHTKVVDSNDYVYFRALNFQGDGGLTAELRLEPTSDPISRGAYDYRIFQDYPFSNGKIQKFDQYTRLDDDGHVANGEAAYYGINFCVEDDHNRGIGIGVIAIDEWSAFNTYVCSEDAASNPYSYCRPGGRSILVCGKDGNDDPCIDNRDQPFNNIDVPPGNAKQLLIVNVVGRGGGARNKNDGKVYNHFNLYAKLAEADEE